MNVVKRDGRKVDFDPVKIRNALVKTFKAADSELTDSDNELIERIIDNVVSTITKQNKELSVEDIQDMIEKKLMASSRKDVARLFITYRNDRTRAREGKTVLIKNVREKLSASNVQNQNANVDERSFGGRKGEALNELMKKIALDDCVSKMSRKNHENNEIYIHDLDSYAVGMHNCTDRNTKFITINGVDSFANHEDGDVVTVLTHDGNWEKATIHTYGKQLLYRITFARSGQRFDIQRFTRNHRWILSDGTITNELKVGDKLYKPPYIRTFNYDTATDSEKYYWCLGFVLADGTEAYRWSHGKKRDDIKFVRLRLCGEKVQYADRFNILQHSSKELDNGDKYLSFSSIIGFRKEFPNLDQMTWKEKLALLDGLYAADGQHAGWSKSIFTSNEQIASFIEDIGPSLGYYILSESDCSGEKTNYGIREFGKEYKFIGDTNKYYWTVIEIQEDTEEDVWCLDVPEDHSFVLPNGITTGNCLSIPFDKLLANGFNTRQTDVRPANSVNTAFQLVAVIFQLQSLQQFGKKLCRA